MVAWGCRKLHTQSTQVHSRLERTNHSTPWELRVSANISQLFVVLVPPTSHVLSKYHTVCGNGWLATGWRVTKLLCVRPSLCRVRHHMPLGYGWEQQCRLHVIGDLDSINQSCRRPRHNKSWVWARPQSGHHVWPLSSGDNSPIANIHRNQTGIHAPYGITSTIDQCERCILWTKSCSSLLHNMRLARHLRWPYRCNACSVECYVSGNPYSAMCNLP